MNQLQHESSPYLQQHAANPVDWHPWGDQALERARKENKPILVSIGYSTCHWCHVMERESFEDPDVAMIMNEYFVNIKIDREERPDLDQLYMEACQALTGSGGWPLNVFLTPDRRPFFAGTYFPPTPGYRRQSWAQALEYAAYNFYENRDAVERQADRIMETLARADRAMTAGAADLPEGEVVFTPALATELFAGILEKADPEAGGFDRAPKFPNTMALEYLLHYHWHSGDAKAGEHLHLSLLKMTNGGIYDHLGGGLARYATDRFWLVPHFEKMLYDNALLVQLMADAYRLDPDERHREVIKETLGFIDREMTNPAGGFYAALDADSEGQEGKFYTWRKAEVEQVLGEDAAWFCEFYDITEGGNWERRNILQRTITVEAFAQKQNEDPGEFLHKLAKAKQKLLQARSTRVRPHRDDKILLSWNALQCTAYAKAYAALGEDHYRETAVRSLEFMLHHFLSADGVSLLHTYHSGKAKVAAYLNDYAFLIESLIEVYQVTFDEALLTRAARLTDHVNEHFYDEASGLYFFTSEQQTDLVLRRHEVYDAEMPSGNAAMIGNLQRLGLIFDRRDWRERAGRMLLAVCDQVRQDPMPFARWATAFLPEIYGSLEIAVVGEKAHQLALDIRRRLIPGSVLMASERPNDEYPLFAHRWQEERTLIYLCRDYACERPVATVEELFQLIRK